MKKYFTISAMLCLILAIAACNSGQGNKPVEPGDITNNTATPDNPAGSDSEKGWPKFENEYHDFGRVTDGESVKWKFKFRNEGKGNLIISDVKPTCGCTTPEWTKEVIPPGGEGFVETLFNSTGRGEVGAGTEQEKSVEVFFQNSAKERIPLTFKATVVKPK
jgi:hypothetical protein